ncbi:Crp/Fnr family transcriptional regulator [Hallella colorans]|uniref:Crp/Fnr family transcriptional regulator n=1 Tax=Hallella colorans TaxID=1703337 RepID=UPI0023F1263F|nr:Crp/Fnr family transcriptional regulator [Hallella colorans]
METFELHKKLISLPLFVGMGHEELSEIIAKTKFDFKKANPGETIVREGEKSGQLLLLVDGDIQTSTYADDHGYEVCEYLRAPLALQPERTFGLAQRYSSTVFALTACNIICINKNETLKLSNYSLIFRLNLLNAISTALQKKYHQDWLSVPTHLEQRICRFFISHCIRPAGRKTFKIKMTRIAEELNDNRLNVSHVLNDMARNDLLTLHRERIDIPAIERLSNSAIS